MKQLYSKQYAGKDRLLNPDFKYVHSSQTDVGETIKRAQAEMQKAQPTKRKVTRIK